VIKLAKIFFGLLFGIIVLYILEGACFRLVEKYAEYRLKIAWGVPGTGTYHSFLKLFPLDHFKELPAESLDSGGSPNDIATIEADYAATVMSFSRPTRDRYEEYVKSKLEPLANFDIRDYGEVSLVLPGLKRTATLEDVNREIQGVRRVGDDLEYSEGMLVRILSSKKPEDYETEFAELESTFGFLLENGIACMVLPATSKEEVLKWIAYLQTKHQLLAENMFAWGDQEAAGYLLEACRENPGKFKGIYVTDPIGAPPPPRMVGLPWLTVQISEKSYSKESDLKNILQWVRSCRMSESLYPSRLGGLLHMGDSPTSGQMPSFFVPCLMQCSRYIERAGNQWPTPKPISGEVVSEGMPKIDSLEKAEEEKPFDLDRIEQTIHELSKEEEETVKLVDATFDCEIVRGYRKLHSNSPNLQQVSNRDLVLMLGTKFEKMGEEVLIQVRERDPHFYRFYLSLRALEDSPLH
jgi:hypothetical protein